MSYLTRQTLQLSNLSRRGKIGKYVTATLATHVTDTLLPKNLTEMLVNKLNVFITKPV
jgi:hypothetical protein